MKALTQEEKQALVEHCKFMLSEHVKYGGYSIDEDIYRIALAALTAEPVAYSSQMNIDAVMQKQPKNLEFMNGDKSIYREPIPLFTTPPLPAVPGGWKLVPVEPTAEMMLHNSSCQHHAWDDKDCSVRQLRRNVWGNMISAAPAPGGDDA